MDSEKKLEKTLREKVKAQNGLALKIFSASFTGLPDRLILIPGGKVYWVELKTTDKKPTSRQAVVHEILRRMGFQVFVIDTMEGLNEFLKQI